MGHNWELYIEIARRFEHKAQYQDRQDLRHTIIVRLAEVAERKGEKPLTEWAMLRVASYVVMEYWRAEKRRPQISVNSQIEDDDGNTIELIYTIADDSAIDLDAWLDARTWLLGCPRRLIQIAHKKVKGIPLDNADMIYLCKWRQKAWFLPSLAPQWGQDSLNRLFRCRILTAPWIRSISSTLRARASVPRQPRRNKRRISSLSRMLVAPFSIRAISSGSR